MPDIQEIAYPTAPQYLCRVNRDRLLEVIEGEYDIDGFTPFCSHIKDGTDEDHEYKKCLLSFSDGRYSYAVLVRKQREDGSYTRKPLLDCIPEQIKDSNGRAHYSDERSLVFFATKEDAINAMNFQCVIEDMENAPLDRDSTYTLASCLVHGTKDGKSFKTTYQAERLAQKLNKAQTITTTGRYDYRFNCHYAVVPCVRQANRYYVAMTYRLA